MNKPLEMQHPVASSNLKSIGCYIKGNAPVITVEFIRGASYDYFGCTLDEFQNAFNPDTSLKDWFNDLKKNKTFKKNSDG